MSTLQKTIPPREHTAHDQLLRVYQLFQVADKRRQEAESALLMYLRARLKADEQNDAKVAQLFDMVATQERASDYNPEVSLAAKLTGQGST